MSRSSLRSVSAILGVGLGWASSSHAAVLTVGQGTQSTFVTISEAVQAARSGDVVLILDNGTYTECVSIEADITLIGSRSGEGRVVLQCDEGAAVTVTGVSAQLIGVGLRGQRGLVADDARVQLTGVLLAGDVDGDGGGVYATNSAILIEHAVVEDATASGRGGGLYVEGGSLTLRHSTVSGAQAEDGGGLYLLDTTATIDHTQVEGNRASASGGGVHVAGSTGLTVSETSLSTNDSPLGGGLYAETGTLEMSRVSFLGNTGTDGAGLWLGVTPEVAGLELSANIASGSGGGLYTQTDLTLQDVLISGNEALQGGGLYLAAGTHTILDGRIADNTATADGGGGYAEAEGVLNVTGTVWTANEATTGDGGGLWLAASATTSAALVGTVFVENTSPDGHGGGLYIARGDGTVSLTGVSASGNEADIGGGIYAGRGPVLLDASAVERNEARLGGGIATTDPSLDTSSTVSMTVQRTLVGENAATDNGGGIYVSNAGVGLGNSWVVDNEAVGHGGGLFTEHGITLQATGSTFCDNSAGGTGGGVHIENQWGNLDLYASVLKTNTSVREGGALFAAGYDTTSGSRRNINAYYLTIMGNDSLGTVFDGVHLNNSVSDPLQLVLRYNHYGYQSYSHVSQSTTASTWMVPLDSVYFGGTVPILNNASYSMGRNGNVSDNPSWTSYTSTDCFDDDLRSIGYTTYGAQATTAALGRRLFVDGGGDGVTIAEGDCDDGNADRFPGKPEVPYDGLDQDCVGFDLRDVDEDGFADLSVGGLDCDDNDPDIHPLAEDAPYDSIDTDCRGLDDDADRDGYASDIDCDDADPATYPGAIEIAFDGVVQDCDGLDLDLDGDGFIGAWTDAAGSLLSPNGTDCDDTNPDIFPGAEDDWYDGVDTDCDGTDDFDQDGDGDPVPEAGGGDCDDTDASVSSLAEERWYDGIDQDCDGADDDQDGDGVLADLDCDDTDANRFPGATETPDDGIDQDCDGSDVRTTVPDNGCAHSGGSVGWTWALAALFALRRNRNVLPIE
ncbi:MAG: putative metal-binding motif-containing protein [Myxococcota bacterium]